MIANSRPMTSEKPNIKSNLAKTLLIILGIVVAMLLSFGSRVIAFDSVDPDEEERLLSKTEELQAPAIQFSIPDHVSDELTTLFLGKLANLK